MSALDAQQKKVNAAIIEAFRLGYHQAHRTALDAAHEVVLAEIRSCVLFRGQSRAAERVYDAVRHALERSSP